MHFYWFSMRNYAFTRLICSSVWREGISQHFQNFSRNLNVDGRNKCRETVSRKISLFSKMQRGRSPSFELLQLDMYDRHIVTWNKIWHIKSQNTCEVCNRHVEYIVSQIIWLDIKQFSTLLYYGYMWHDLNIRRLSVCPSVCLSGSHTFLVVTHSYMFCRQHMQI